TGNRELLHDIFFSYEKHDYSFQFEGCECLVKTVANPYNRTTITVYVREYTEHEDVWVDVVCNLEKMPRTLAESVAHQFEDYVKALVGEMLTPLSQIPLVPEPAQQQVHSALQGPELASTSLDFLTQFEEQVATKAKQVAIQVGTSSLTFGELNTRANQIAHWLRHQKAVQPGDVVAMYLARTDWLLPILLGIMKAGAAWLPIDRKSPTARVTTILADSGAVLLLCEDEHLTALQDLPGIISRSAMVGELDSEGDHNPVPSLTATSLAYMIYTSGTTGTPKGVEISHGALNNFLQSMAISPGLHSDDRWLASTSYAFDISILEMLLPLQVGATLVIADEVQAADPIALSELFEEAEPTVMQGTPSLWAMLIEAGWKGSKHLKLLSGGEKLPASLAAGLQTRCAELWNMFGPTETTIWSALESIQGDDVAIGKPIHNTEFYVLGHEGDLLPEGAIGELYIGGAGVARGYHNHPELTAQKFVPDTQFPGQRMYQTGDLGYQLQGRLHFIRRMDTQVKIRGHRIETAEVEAVLLQHESISQATVLVHSPQEGESFLTAYVVGNPPLTTEGISSFLAEFLPPYMIPAFIDVLDEMPLTISGKVDGHALRRRALPQVSSTSESAEETYDSLTRKVRSLWVEVLGNPHIGLQDSFFLLGGDSLKAVRILSRINRELSIQVALKTLFDAPRLADFCQQLREARQATYTEIPVAPDQETYPLSPAQHRIWLLSQREQGSLAYTMKEAFQLRGSLDESALSQAVAALLAKHPVLRTQVAHPQVQPAFAIRALWDYRGG
ncbi:MAG: amino acid adenylation domain-containing protein, partial [Bacteroidota bacterium]